MTGGHIYTGDADELAITVTDEDGYPVDLLNTTVTWAIARNAHTDPVLEKDTDDAHRSRGLYPVGYTNNT